MELFARGDWQDRLRPKDNREGDRERNHPSRYHKWIVVDQLTIERVDRRDMGDTLPLSHDVGQRAHIELHLAVDDVELVVVQLLG